MMKMKYYKPITLSVSASFVVDEIESNYGQKDYRNHSIMAKINNMKNVRKYLTQSAPEIFTHCVSYAKCNNKPISIFTELNLKIGSDLQNDQPYNSSCHSLQTSLQTLNTSHDTAYDKTFQNDKRLGDSMIDLRRTCEIRKNDVIFNIGMIKPYSTKHNQDNCNKIIDNDNNDEYKKYDIDVKNIKPYKEWIKSFDKNPFHTENNVSLNLFDNMLNDMQIERIYEMRRYSNSFLVYESMVTKPKDGIFNMNYINNKFVDASYIGDKYIACSAPKPVNFGSWWNMVIKHVSIILALSPYQEKGRVKMDKYLPDGDHGRYTYGNITISCSVVKSNEYAKNNITVKKITLIKNNANKSISDFKVLYHIHYDGWTDFRSPDIHQFECLMNVFDKYKILSFGKNRNNLPLVHCSAGVGRTGTFIAIHDIISNIGTGSTLNNTVFNIVKKINDMRLSRCDMVQTEEQFRFIYEYIAYFLKSYKFFSYQNI